MLSATATESVARAATSPIANIVHGPTYQRARSFTPARSSDGSSSSTSRKARSRSPTPMRKSRLAGNIWEGSRIDSISDTGGSVSARVPS